MTHRSRKILAVAATLLLVTPLTATAQRTDRAVSLRAGPSQYDLSGTGTAPFVALDLGLSVAPRIIIEAGVGYLGYDSQADERTHHVLPEIQAQWTGTGNRLRPYLGAGVGASWAIRPGEDGFDPTLSSALGLRVMAGSGWILRAELRVRSIDPWVGTTGDWGFGVGRSF